MFLVGCDSDKVPDDQGGTTVDPVTVSLQSLMDTAFASLNNSEDMTINFSGNIDCSLDNEGFKKDSSNKYAADATVKLKKDAEGNYEADLIIALTNSEDNGTNISYNKLYLRDGYLYEQDTHEDYCGEFYQKQELESDSQTTVTGLLGAANINTLIEKITSKLSAINVVIPGNGTLEKTIDLKANATTVINYIKTIIDSDKAYQAACDAADALAEENNTTAVYPEVTLSAYNVMVNLLVDVIHLSDTESLVTKTMVEEYLTDTLKDATTVGDVIDDIEELLQYYYDDSELTLSGFINENLGDLTFGEFFDMLPGEQGEDFKLENVEKPLEVQIATFLNDSITAIKTKTLDEFFAMIDDKSDDQPATTVAGINAQIDYLKTITLSQFLVLIEDEDNLDILTAISSIVVNNLSIDYSVKLNADKKLTDINFGFNVDVTIGTSNYKIDFDSIIAIQYNSGVTLDNIDQLIIFPSATVADFDEEKGLNDLINEQHKDIVITMTVPVNIDKYYISIDYNYTDYIIDYVGFEKDEIKNYTTDTNINVVLNDGVYTITIPNSFCSNITSNLYLKLYYGAYDNINLFGDYDGFDIDNKYILDLNYNSNND